MAIAALCGSGCIIPFATPPLRGEVGAASVIGQSSPSSLHVAVGAHLASGTRRRDQPFDLGLGWIFEANEHTSASGGYVDGALFIDRTRRTRTSAGARSELRFTPEGPALAAKLRLDYELYGATTGTFLEDTDCGSMSGRHYGTGAIGLFAETGHVWLPDGNAWVATAGVTLRLPSAIGVWVGIPWCD